MGRCREESNRRRWRETTSELSYKSSYSWEHLRDEEESRSDSFYSSSHKVESESMLLINLSDREQQHHDVVPSSSNSSTRIKAKRLLQTSSNLSKSYNKDGQDTETIISYDSVREMARRGSLVGRFLVSAIFLAVLSVSSFATTNVIIDKFNLYPQDMLEWSEQSFQSLERDTIIDTTTSRFLLLREALSNISDSTVFDDLSQPQTKALDWIANKDTMQLEADSSNLVQRYALVVLFYSTGGPTNWERNLGWLSPNHECEWKGEGGVRSCNEQNEVTDLSLWNNLKGTIPMEVGHLTRLNVLYLARNSLSGTIPETFSQLVDLSYLGLQHNSLSGQIPPSLFDKMQKLSALFIEKNDFTGTIQKTGNLCRLGLRQFSADCRRWVKWKDPEITCQCCTKCFSA